MEEVALKPLELVTDTRVLTSQKENFNYGLIKYGTPIYKSRTAGTIEIIYQVPEGKIFFLTTLTLSGIHTATNGDRRFKILSDNYGDLLRMDLRRCSGSIEETGVMQLSLIPPMLFYQGDIIRVSQNGTGLATGVITGYELEISMKDQFI